MDKRTPDEIAHLTENHEFLSKETCPHINVVEVAPTDVTLYICLDCGLESSSLNDFK